MFVIYVIPDFSEGSKVPAILRYILYKLILLIALWDNIATRLVNKINVSLNKMLSVYEGVFKKNIIKRLLILSPLQAKVKMAFGNEQKT